MGITFREAQFLTESLANKSKEELLRQAGIFRRFGTRIAVCEKNVGSAKYAFNALQIKFMPEFLRCPSSVCAGFMKDGRLFEGSGIET